MTVLTRRFMSTALSSTAAVAMTALLLACASDGPTVGKIELPLPPTPFVVSNPVAQPTAVATGIAASPRASGDIAWVSLPSGTIPGASAVMIRARRTGAQVIAPVTDGGLDPVAVPADAGDTLDVSVQGVPAGDPSSYLTVVPVISAPRVVRTNPPKHKRDVPLNSIIIVTFSEPMDSASLAGAITLSAGGAAVPGTVSVPPQDSGVLRARFVPAAPLAPLTSYVLQVASTARDRDGTPLDSVLRTDFVTGTDADTTAPVITILTQPGDTMPYLFPTVRFVVSGEQDPVSVYVFMDTLAAGPEDFYAFGFGHPAIPSGSETSFRFPMWTGPGTYRVVIRATDVSGNVATASLTGLALVEPDTQPRIEVQSFTVYEDQDSLGRWSYWARLVVADAPGQSGLAILGFEMLEIPGLCSPRCDMGFPARSLTVYSGAGVQILDPDGGGWTRGNDRSSGGQARARITYRDMSGHPYALTIQGAIVAGPPPAEPPDPYWCPHWTVWGITYLSPGCPATSPEAQP